MFCVICGFNKIFKMLYGGYFYGGMEEYVMMMVNVFIVMMNWFMDYISGDVYLEGYGEVVGYVVRVVNWKYLLVLNGIN